MRVVLGKFVHIGCGTTVGKSWENFDASPTLRMARLPIVGPSVSKLAQAVEFPKLVRYGDIVKGLPVADGSARAIFASHVLEHLALEDMRKALGNCLRILEPGGSIRLIVPDLEARAKAYIAARHSGDASACHKFIASCYLGESRRPRGPLGLLRSLLGNSAHLWMYDVAAMRRELESVGFINIRQVRFGDSKDAPFNEIESEDRYWNEGQPEVALAAERPR